MDEPEVDNEILFGQRMVQQGLVKREQVQECLRLQARLAAEGVSPLPTIGQLLFKQGYLTAGQLQQTIRMSARATAITQPAIPKAQPVPEGERFGKYIKTAKIGEGGMGEVWRAWDTELSRWVALKFLFGRNSEEVARFRREAQTAARLNHPNIAAIYEAGENYLAMQVVVGQTLDTYPRNDVRRCVEIVRQVALAVHYAHEHGVIHRDIKPANIMVEKGEAGSERVYLMDFGLAKPTDAASSVSASGSALGTPCYMSPEQARGGHVLDRRTDVYSLGATLYELMTNTPPFEDQDVIVLLAKVAHDEPRPIHETRPKVARDLETIVMKCLEKEADRRYATAADLAGDLGRWLAGEAVAAHPPSVLHRVVKGAVKRRAMSAALLVGFLAIMGAATYAWVLHREALSWALEARTRANAGDFEGAKKLLDQARVRRVSDDELYALCEAKILERRELSEAKSREDAIFGPIRTRLEQLPATLEGWQRGLALLDEGLAKFGGSWDAWKMKADLLARLQRFPEALDAYLKAFQLNPRLAVARYLRGQILMEMSKIDEAKAEFEAALKAEPKNEYALIGGARLAVIEKDYREALRLLDEAEPIARHMPDYYFLRGCLHDDEVSPFLDFKQAIRDYTNAIEKDPYLVLAYNNRGDAKRVLGDVDGAIEDLSRAIEIRPQLAPSYNARATARRIKGDLVGALADANKAIDLEPGFAGAYFTRGNVRRDQGDTDGAIGDYSRALSLNSRDARIYNNRALLYEAKGELDKALADFTTAVEINPRLAGIWANRAVVREKKGDDQGAMADYDKAIEVDPKIAALYSDRGRLRDKLDDTEGALADFAKALQLDPKHVNALLNRADLYLRLKKNEAAIADYEAVLKIVPKDWASRPKIEETLRSLKNP